MNKQQLLEQLEVHIPATGDERAAKNLKNYHYDVRFLLGVTSDEIVIQNRESKELRLVAKYRLKLPTQAASVARMFDKWCRI